MAKSIVYLATNKVNGKRYIGVTSQGFAVRRRQHEKAPNAKRITCRIFHAAMAKYGAASFDWMLLGEYDSFQEALAAEIKLISEIRPEYNVSLGGQGYTGKRRPNTPEERAKKKLFRHSPETRAKISQALRLRERSPETARKISAAKKGKSFSDEHRRNLSLSHIGHKASPEAVEKNRRNYALRQKDSRGRLV